MTTTTKEPETIPELEVPDEDVRHCLALLKPILEMTITELYNRGRPGWGNYLETVYHSIDDVMSAANAEGS